MNTCTTTSQPQNELIALPTDGRTATVDLNTIPAYTSANIQQPVLSETTLEDLTTYFKWSEELKNDCTQIRAISDSNTRTKLKAARLPYFVVARFKDNYRNKEHFRSTRFMILDLDHLDGDYERIRKVMKEDPHTFVMFQSPSGNGLKVIFEFAEEVISVEEYVRLYKHYSEKFAEAYGITPDGATYDPSRACFYSYDPDIVIRPDHALLGNDAREIVGGTKRQARADQLPQDKEKKPKGITKAFEPQIVSNRTHTLTQQIGYSIRKGLSLEATLATAKLWNQTNPEPLTEEKLEYTVRDLYERYAKEERYEPFWSYENDVYQFGMSGDEFFTTRIGRRKFEIQVNAKSKDEREEVFEHLVQTKHLPYLKRVDHIGDIEAEKSYFEVDSAEGVITVHHAACPKDVEDNTAIEGYLESKFGAYTAVIKEWLAVYTYSNYKKLPTIILQGPRGVGKNMVAELVMAIYPGLSQMWHGKEKNFTPEMQMKLLVADESISGDEGQYRMLKKYSGQSETVVNQKYMKEYKIRNNMNIFILSNAERPIFVEREELPTDVRNNQFLVYRMTPFAGAVDVELPEKLKKRLGHYIRTVLNDVWQRIKGRTDCRYSIEVPITDEERSLFDLNKSDLDEELDKILDQMHGAQGDEYENFFDAGYFPRAMVTSYNLPRGISKNDVYRRLKERGYCESGASSNVERRTVGGKRERCLVMTEKLKTWYSGKEKLAA